MNPILERNNLGFVLAHFENTKCENLKNVSLIFFKFSIHSSYSVSARGTNRQFYCTGVIIYNKTKQPFFFC